MMITNFPILPDSMFNALVVMGALEIGRAHV